MGITSKINKVLKDSESNLRYVEYDIFPGTRSNRYFNPEKYICVGMNSTNGRRAVMFIEWLMTNQDNYDLFMYGIKGKDYKIDKSGNIKVMSYNGEGDFEPYANEHRIWSFRNDNLEHLGKKYISDYIKKVELLSKYPLHTGVSGFITGIRFADQMEYNETISITYNAEYNMLSGADQMNEGWLKIGPRKKVLADSITAKMQQQLDAWRTSKH
jgi:hypothetical protein